MENRADVWRKYLMRGIHEKRKLYDNVVAHFPFQPNDTIIVEIDRDIPRTNIPGCGSNDEQIKTLLNQYVQIMPCDGYLQGFNYIISVLYHVYDKNDSEHAMADAWWSLSSVVAIVRPMIPDHDPRDYTAYTKQWAKYYINHLVQQAPRTHHWMCPFYESILPTLTVKWLMIWFTQLFDIKNVLVVWDALITCEPKHRTKLMAIIAANITIQHADSIETWSVECPSEIGFRLLSVKAVDAKVIINNSIDYMVHYKMPF